MDDLPWLSAGETDVTTVDHSDIRVLGNA